MARKQTAPATPAATAPLTVDRLPAFPIDAIASVEKSYNSETKRIVNLWLDTCRPLTSTGDEKIAGIVAQRVQRALEDAENTGTLTLAKATRDAYVNGAKRAIYWGVEWNSNLHTDKARKLPGSRTASTAKTLSRAKLDEKVGAALDALRVFGLTAVAADVIDAIRKALPDWQEPAGK
jgi:hypothetical protein